MEIIVGAPLWRADLFECWGAAIGFGGILIQVLLVAAHMDNLEVAVDTARSLSRPTGGHVLQTSGVSTPQANPGLPYLNQSPEPAATAGAAAPCSFPTAGNSTPQANEKFVTNEVVSSVPPVPPAIWADWNKDDTLLGVARCHM